MNVSDIVKTLDRQSVLDVLSSISVVENVENALRPLSRFADSDSQGDVFVCGAVGHGMMCWRFRLVLRCSNLHIDVTLPCWRALSDSGARGRDGENIRTVCRFVLAVLGSEDFPPADERFELTGDEHGNCSWRIFSAEGEELRSGDGWNSAIGQLGDAALSARSDEFVVFYP